VTIDEARQILAALLEEGVEFVLIGSMAMAVQGLPRATHDMDFFVAPDTGNLERLKRALRRLFDDPDVEQIDAAELIGSYPALEYVPPHGRYSMDILTRLGEAFRYSDVAAGSEVIDLAGLPVRVATPRLLYRMKKDTVRPQDRADAARIREAFDLKDE
jgi:hypothetical protein